MDDKLLIAELKTRLDDGEKVESIVSGISTGEVSQNGIIAITNKKFIFYNEANFICIDFFKIIKIKSTLLNNKIKIELINGTVTIKIKSGNSDKFIDLLWKHIPQNRKDPLVINAIGEESLKLDDLKQKGLIDDATFRSKKQKLSRITMQRKSWHPKNSKILKVAISLCVVAYIVIMFSLISKIESDSVKMPVEKLAYYAAVQAVEKNLKAPKTAEFLGYSESVVVKLNNDGDYIVTLKVDSENSFGATIRSTFKVIVRDYGDEWRLMDINELK